MCVREREREREKLIDSSKLVSDSPNGVYMIVAANRNPPAAVKKNTNMRYQPVKNHHMKRGTNRRTPNPAAAPTRTMEREREREEGGEGGRKGEGDIIEGSMYTLEHCSRLN